MFTEGFYKISHSHISSVHNKMQKCLLYKIRDLIIITMLEISPVAPGNTASQTGDVPVTAICFNVPIWMLLVMDSCPSHRSR